MGTGTLRAGGEDSGRDAVGSRRSEPGWRGGQTVLTPQNSFQKELCESAWWRLVFERGRCGFVQKVAVRQRRGRPGQAQPAGAGGLDTDAHRHRHDLPYGAALSLICWRPLPCAFVVKHLQPPLHKLEGAGVSAYSATPSALVLLLFGSQEAARLSERVAAGPGTSFGGGWQSTGTDGDASAAGASLGAAVATAAVNTAA